MKMRFEEGSEGADGWMMETGEGRNDQMHGGRKLGKEEDGRYVQEAVSLATDYAFAPLKYLGFICKSKQ